MRFSLPLRDSATLAISCMALSVLLFLAASGSIAAPLFPNPIFNLSCRVRNCGPSSINITDLNHDGAADLIAGDPVMMLLGDGSGDFPQITRQEAWSISLVGDFNGDRNSDIVIAIDKDFSVLLGNGNATFGPPISLGVPGAPRAVSDFNNDGRQDLVMSDSLGFLVLLGHGDGTFGSAVPVGVSGTKVAVGDYNGDGRQDLAVVEPVQIRVLLGVGDGTFTPGDALYEPDGYAITSMTSEDFDQDGRDDLVIASSILVDGRGICTYAFNDDGTFRGGTFTQCYREPFNAHFVATGDLNADGTLDLVVADRGSASRGITGDVVVFVGIGDGTFSPRVRLGAGLFAESVATGDLNNDGKQDLAVANADGGDVAVFFGLGDGINFRQTVAGVSSASVVVGDFNSDGQRDLAASSGALLGLGDGTFAPLIPFEAKIPRSLVLGDFNSDEHEDLAGVDCKSGEISILLGAGDGTFDLQNRLPGVDCSSTGWDGKHHLVVGDLNGDGAEDLVTPNFVLLSLGDGTFAPPAPFEAGERPTSIALGDFNTDGLPDAVVTICGSYGDLNDRVSVLLGNGNGTFAAPISTLLGGEEARCPIDVAVGDLNHDGKKDLAVTNFLSSNGLLLLGNGDGTFQEQFRFSVGDFPEDIVISDFNSDGDEDVGVANANGGTPYFSSDMLNVHKPSGDQLPFPGAGGSTDISVLLGNGDGTLRPQVRFAPGAGTSIAEGDFDNDGRIDLVGIGRRGEYFSWVDQPGLSILLNQGPFPNRPPAARAVAVSEAECDSPDGATLVLDGSVSSDPDSTPGTSDDIVSFEWFEHFQPSSRILVGTGESLNTVLPLGPHLITLQVRDRHGESSTDDVVVTVIDTRAPALALSLSPSLLWPPNHRMVDIAAVVAASDTCGAPTVLLTSIIGTEPDDAPGAGDGDTLNDIRGAAFGTPDFDFQLRAERDGHGEGRAYQISYRAIDVAGNAAASTSFLFVPHDLMGVTEPVQVSVLDTSVGTVLNWDPVNGAINYRIVRGLVSNLREAGDFIDLGSLTCIEATSIDTNTTSHEDDDTPALSEAFFYLVAYSDGRDSGYGTDTANKPRLKTGGGCD